MSQLAISTNDTINVIQGALSFIQHPQIKADNGRLSFYMIDFTFIPENPLLFSGECIVFLSGDIEYGTPSFLGKYDPSINELTWRVRNYIQ